MPHCVALLRGVNVGNAKRISMANLKQLVEALGHGDVRTLLNSGNVLFHSPRPNVAKLASTIHESIREQCGFSTAVTVITAATLERIVAENPLLKVAKDPARHLVAFATEPKALAKLQPLTEKCWKPDALAITGHAAYLWCASGVLDSPVMKNFMRQATDSVTARNWATVLKLQALTRIAQRG